MTVLINVTVDLDDTEALEEHGSLENGVYGVDEDGVYHMYHCLLYTSPSPRDS